MKEGCDGKYIVCNILALCLLIETSFTLKMKHFMDTQYLSSNMLIEIQKLSSKNNPGDRKHLYLEIIPANVFTSCTIDN